MKDSTKHLLSHSLRKLLQTKPLSKVTIQDITSASGVNRMTFYYHFHDIYELVEWSFRNEIFDVSEDQVLNPANWEAAILKVFDTIIQNKSFILNIYRSISREQVEEHLIRGMEESIKAAMCPLLDKAGIKAEDQEFYLNFYLYGYAGTILVWIDQNMKEDPAIIVKRFSEMMKLVLTMLDSMP
ncbi:MAG: TetR/AcrR family transcriptional regulator [Firmicutes bacterium]|nr:TetR/AcrR family transcriptional regulator [Bacillota bacterium]